ncbi:hypothetical protein [Derxia gummosa]|uniref:Uncharacterized protein n=1 Tax=Derxia gummosa DSM 723 TaxID=1121388 RepID=A0A8B6X8L6_9BURK|nr:hypothetical protein [Derxia gummosa]
MNRPASSLVAFATRVRPGAVARRLAVLLGLGLIATGASAGSLAGGDWQPSKCGARPEPPALDLRNADAFNKSVDGVNTYRQAARTYLDCVVAEANADLQTVTRVAREAQQSARAAEDKIQADLRAANEKFK